MTEKVKVSMFLDPEVAQAVKVQAARTEGSPGVSEIMRTVIACAHCGEPITGDFVIGPPKLVAPSRYGVFFHGDRTECVKAAGPRVSFLATCPKCKQYAHHSFERTKLYENAVIKQRVRLSCINCDEHWDATSAEIAGIVKLLGRA